VSLKTKNRTLKELDRSPEVGIVMGSDSDFEIMEETASVLKKFGVPYEMTVASAHRNPKKAAEFASSAHKRGNNNFYAPFMGGRCKFGSLFGISVRRCHRHFVGHPKFF